MFKERKWNRLKDYDYSQTGYYFVTICTKDRIEYFGNVMNHKMILNDHGMIVRKYWLKIPNHFLNVVLDKFIIMPNHIHGIIVIVGGKNYYRYKNNYSQYCYYNRYPRRGQKFLPPTILWQTKLSRSLPSIIRGFKIGVTKYFRNINNHEFQWQRSFYDHIIRNNESLQKIREYIINNPKKWELDRNNN